jgi:hypothetical protein
MSLNRLLRTVAGEVWRNRHDLVLASIGIVIGAAAFTYLLGLGAGVRQVVLGKIFPLDQLEVVPRTLNLDLMALRFGIGSDVIDEAAVEKIRAIPGARTVFPKMELTAPAVMSGGASLLGSDIYTELIADGIDPELVAGELGRGGEFRDLDDPNDPRNADSEPQSCWTDHDCQSPMYCVDTGAAGLGSCRHPIPVIASNHMVELYNGSICRAYGLPKLNPDAALGLTADLAVGASTFGQYRRDQVIRLRLVLVGFSDRAIPLGITMPIGYVKRLNTVFGTPEDATRYHSVIIDLDSELTSGEVAAAIRKLGFEVADHGKERVALLMTVLIMIFGLVSMVIVAVAAVNIMHVFFMLISERRREIGVLRAVGATRGDIRTIILGEATVVGLLAGLAGVLVALLACRLSDLAAESIVPDFPYKPETFFAVSPGLAIAAVVFSVTFCIFGAALPASRAAATDPARALSD